MKATDVLTPNRRIFHCTVKLRFETVLLAQTKNDICTKARKLLRKLRLPPNPVTLTSIYRATRIGTTRVTTTQDL